jgi:hypothetical protein
MTQLENEREPGLRERAVARLKKKRDFRTHVVVFVMINAFLVLIWVMTTPDGFFWPMFPLLGWGFGVVMNAWDVYFVDDFSEESIQREVERLQRDR